MAIWEDYAQAVKSMLPFAHAVPVDRSTMDFVSPYRALLQSVKQGQEDVLATPLCSCPVALLKQKGTSTVLH